MKYVVDTNIINWLVDDRIDRSMLPTDGPLVAMHIQIDELNRTSNAERRARLFLVATQAISELLPTESMVIDVSRLDYCKLSDGVLFESLRERLNVVNAGKSNNAHDALIAEVAIVNNFTLLTADADLATVARWHGCEVVQFAGRP